MGQDQKDVKCLVDEYKRLRAKGRGRLEVHITKRDKLVSVQIFATDRHDFMMEPVKNTDY